jgi:protein-disulfide isomerase
LRSFPQIPLSLALVIASACSPACTAPEAKAPDEGSASQPGSGPGSAGSGNSERDKARADLPKGEEIREARGVSLDELGDSQRASFFQLINSEPSACDKPQSIAQSLRDDAACRDSLVAAQFIADMLRAGITPTDIRGALEEVVAALHVREIPVKGRPLYGNANAPVTVVVFADFTCPHCRAEAPKLRAAIDQFRGRAKLYYKHFPLSGPGHDRSRPAALAAEAALEQGKFWEMHDLIFANQDELDDAQLTSFAERIGLDMGKYKASVAAKRGEAMVEADRLDGEKLDIHGTPAVFVNGREMHQLLFGGSVAGWIDDALKR